MLEKIRRTMHSNLVQFCLCVVLYLNCSEAKEYKVALLIGYGYETSSMGYERSAAALTMAEELLRERRVIDKNVSFRYTWRSSPGIVQVVGRSKEFWEKGVDIIIGPTYSMYIKPALYLAAYENHPHWSWTATHSDLSDKKIFSTFARTLGSFAKLATLMDMINLKYGWNRVATFFIRSGWCEFGLDAYTTHANKANYTITENIVMDRSQEVTDEYLDDVLDRIRQRARIIIFCISLTDERRFMVRAAKRGMTNGEYVFFFPGTLNVRRPDEPWKVENSSDNEIAWQAYKVLKEISWASGDPKQEAEFRRLLPYKMTQPPWLFNRTLERFLAGETNSDGGAYSPYLHDVMYLYGTCINRTIDEGLDHRNGTIMLDLVRGMEFEGVSGLVRMNENADREPDYWVWDYREINGVRKRIVSIAADMKLEKLVIKSEPEWNTPGNIPPLDKPVCGFLNEKCPAIGTDGLIAGTMSSVFFLLVAIGIAVYIIRKKKFEEELQRMLWKVNFEDVKFSKHKRGLGSQIFASSASFYHSRNSITDEKTDSYAYQIFTLVGQCRGQIVAVKKINKTAFVLNRKDLLELKAMRDLSHENVNSFVGACIEPQMIFILYTYCSKGSVVDILENDDIKLDGMFKTSMIQDLSNGLGYLHQSYIRYHGHLKSSNCVIDNRWVLKITDFGMNRLLKDGKVGNQTGEYEKFRGMWWTAPEMLCASNSPIYGTQKGDIYSLGIIMFEILMRRAPYSTDIFSPKDIVNKIKEGSLIGQPFRPEFLSESFDEVSDQWQELIKSCWHPIPENRCEIVAVKKHLKIVNKGKSLNIMDHMLAMMEKYANNLEGIVEQRTEELIEEKKKTDNLLYRMLPRVVAEKLKQGEEILPEIFERVSIYFSDIVGFTTISASSKPVEVVDLLNDLYTMFDSNIEKYDVYKVETIGDAYMVVSGLPKRNDDHAGQVADMALSLLSSVLSFKVRHMPDVQLQIRIGIHTGPCCAGVVGLAMPRYCLFGDTVNTASRMESTGEGLRIHASNTCAKALYAIGGYKLSCRGEILVKGKGNQITYWVDGKQDFSGKLPQESDLKPEHLTTGSKSDLPSYEDLEIMEKS